MPVPDSSSRPLRKRQLALLSSSVLDIPPRTRAVILVAGLAGVGLIVMGSLLSGGKPDYVETDKVIHFSGYAILAFLFVTALRPALFVPALIALVGIGLAVEQLQAHTGRTKDLADAIANSLGVICGALAGLVGRAVYAYIRTELADAEVERRTMTFRAGDVIFGQGSVGEEFYVVRGGRVRAELVREDGKRAALSLGPGEVLGAVAAIRGEPRGVTVVAEETTVLYRLTLDDLAPETLAAAHQPAVTVIDALARQVKLLAENADLVKLDRSHG
jgi:hypothetical protein